MRLIVAVAGRGVLPNTMKFGAPSSHERILDVHDLAPQGLPLSSPSLDPATVARASEIFEKAGEDAVVELGEPGSWPLVGALLERLPKTRALFIYPRPLWTLARLLESGIETSDVIDRWQEAVDEMLSVYRRHRSAAVLLDDVSISNAPTALKKFCNERYDFPLTLTMPTAQQPEPLFLVMADRLVDEAPDIAAREAELRAASTPFEAPVEGGRAVAVEALSRLRDLIEQSNETKRFGDENALLRSQLHLVQSKVEINLKRAQDAIKSASSRALEAEIAKLQAENQQLVKSIAQLRASMSWKVTAPVRAASRLLRRAFRARRIFGTRQAISLVRKSPLFNATWYREQYADVAQRGFDAAEHYVRHGAKEGRAPGPDFDAEAYLHANPDVAVSGANPLVHYLKFGKAENRPLAPKSGASTMAKLSKRALAK